MKASLEDIEVGMVLILDRAAVAVREDGSLILASPARFKNGEAEGGQTGMSFGLDM